MAVWVNGYVRSDGTYVKGHWRSSPDNSFYNNWSTLGNINPYTGEYGTRTLSTSTLKTTSVSTSTLELTTRMSDDYTASVFTSGMLAVGNGGNATGIIESKSDRDWFKISLQAGKNYEFELSGPLSLKSNYETLVLYNSSGNILSYKYDRDIINGPLISFTPSVSGTYFLEASDTLGGNIGSYTISALSSTPEINQVFTGNSSNETFTGGSGDDNIDGAAGIDTAVFTLAKSNYLITKTGSEILVKANSGTDGTDTLTNIERIKFSDQSIAFDISGNAGKVAKILCAVFGSSAVSNKQYAGTGLQLMDGGMSYDELAALAIKTAGVKSQEAVVNLLWSNLMGNNPTFSEAQPLINMLATDLSNVEALGVMAAEHVATIGKMNLSELSLTGLGYI